MENQIETVETDNVIAIISYITFIGLIIAFVMNKDKKENFASYHIKQSLGIALIAITLMLVGVIPILGWIVSFLGFFVILILWISGLINALNGVEKPVPVLGKTFETWFKNIK